MGRERSEPPASLLVMILCSIGLAFMAADFVPSSLYRLRYLGIWYPALLDYTPVLAPAAGFVIYLLLRRRGPLLAGVAGLLLPSFLLPAVANWADHRPAKVQVVRWVDSNDLRALEDRVGFKVHESGTADGAELWVRPENASQLAREAGRLGILQESGRIKPRPPARTPATTGRY